MCPIQKLDLIRVSNTFFSFDQFARLRNCSWSEFLVQTLLLIIGSRHNYTWPESPRNILLLIGMLNTLINPDQSLRQIYFSWSVCPIQKLHLIRVSGTYISLDECARYRNYSWSEFLLQTLPLNIGSYQNYSRPQSPINKFLLISVPDTEITPNQSLRYIYFSWSVCPILKLLLIRVSGANITL